MQCYCQLLSNSCIEKSFIFTCPLFVLRVSVVLGYNSGFPMDEEEINEEILRLHGYTSEGDSDDGGKTELDEFYYYHKPQPIDIDPNRDNIIRAGVTKISKNQMKRLRKKFADDESRNKNENLNEVGTPDRKLVNRQKQKSLKMEDGAPNSQLLTKRQKKRLKGKKKLAGSEKENPVNCKNEYCNLSGIDTPDLQLLGGEKENLVNEETESCDLTCVGTLDAQLFDKVQENPYYEKNENWSLSNVGIPDSQLLTKSEKKSLKIKKNLISSESSLVCSQNIPEVKKEEESPDDGVTKRFDLLQEENLVQFEQNKPKKGRSFVDLFLLWLRNSYKFRTFAAVLIVMIVCKKVPYFYNLHKRL